MLLSELVGKNVYSGKNLRGTLSGVCISLKSRAIKYLLCCTNEKNAKTEFSVGVSAIERIDEDVRLKRLKPILPRQCARVFINRPIYSDEGAYLGHLADLEIKNYTATKLITGNGKNYPAHLIAAIDDAVILKKTPPYPIGQRVPAPAISLLQDKAEGEKHATDQPVFITKNLLKSAIEKGNLIRLTLSLNPFCQKL